MQGEYRKRPLILLPAFAPEHVRLFKDVPNLNFSLRIQATAIWSFRLKITNCDLKFRRKRSISKCSEIHPGLLIGDLRHVQHQRPQKNINEGDIDCALDKWTKKQ